MRDFIKSLSICLAFSFLNPAYGHQTQQDTQSIVVKPIKLSGPRVGITYLSDKFVNKVYERNDISLEPWMAQFGWQHENRFFTIKSGATAITEWVFLVGGFEQEKFIPSISCLIGMRSSRGIEFAAGPNLSLSGSSLVIATGVTFRSDEINFPINIAYSTSQSGGRFSLLFGFNIRDPD